jgi:hypothetical protein
LDDIIYVSCCCRTPPMRGETGEKVEGRPGLHPEFGSHPHFSSSRFPGNLPDPQGFFDFSSPLRKILMGFFSPSCSEGYQIPER